jgi:hypothetical protein
MEDRSAFDAAQKRLAELMEKIAAEKNKIADSQARLIGYERELAEMDRWLSVWYDLTGTAKPTAAERMEINPPPRTRRPKNPDRDDVVNQSLEIIRKHGAPLSRKELFDALAKQGTIIRGKDPEMVLSTMLWRSQEKIVRLPNHGYWPKDTDYDPANYAAALDDLIGAADPNPEGGEIEDDADD